eukprot:TRINITY_DN8414_c0_g1_i3.p1 TRINITY_DN8414_c0_g1~~TRINITY_DN8414_c0_g1_i3.p1  ORF type:complete len:486 (+),score=14.68 TRINITY_DN8414_c0_g1_i3:131-1588(+)
MENSLIWGGAGLLIIIYGFLFQIINQNIPESYMDEIFHIPQAQNYCKGKFFEWDPMITTFPGLYLLAAPYGVLLQKLQFKNINQLCDVAILRSINLILGVVNYFVFCQIWKKLHSQSSELKTSLMGLLLSVYPTHFFFNFLFYTDVGSVLTILLAYLSILQKKFYLTTIFTAISVLFRQTNVVWVCYILGYGILQEIGLVEKVASASDIFKKLLDKQKIIFQKFWSLLLVPISFILFVVINEGSIVVGDKSAHTPVKNWAQILYFAWFVLSMFWPLLVFNSHSFQFVNKIVILLFNTRENQANQKEKVCQKTDKNLSVSRKNISLQKINRIICVLVGVFVLLVGIYSQFVDVLQPHPYLLADNRHYTFYIWRKILNKSNLLKIFLIPLYVFSWLILTSQTQIGNQPLVFLGFLFSLFLVLVPAWLLEFRYFTVGAIILILNIKQVTWVGIVANLLYFTVINLFTIYMFVQRPFYWPDGSVARFIW